MNWRKAYLRAALEVSCQSDLEGAPSPAQVTQMWRERGGRVPAAESRGWGRRKGREADLGSLSFAKFRSLE